MEAFSGWIRQYPRFSDDGPPGVQADIQI